MPPTPPTAPASPPASATPYAPPIRAGLPNTEPFDNDPLKWPPARAVRSALTVAVAVVSGLLVAAVLPAIIVLLWADHRVRAWIRWRFFGGQKPGAWDTGVLEALETPSLKRELSDVAILLALSGGALWIWWLLFRALV